VKRGAAVEAVFQPVRPPTTFEETVERLGTAIRVGLLAPGSKLPAERQLAEELGISRSTLRQALTTLTQSGHLTSARGRSGGTFVADRPPLSGEQGNSDALGGDAWAVLDHRVSVEVGSAMLAAERAEAADLEALAELVERMGTPTDFEAYRRADIRFHIGLAEAAHSPVMVTEMTEVQGQMSDLIARIAHPEEVLTRSNAQHRQLVAHLRSGDAGAAATVIRSHIRGTEHILAGLV
jgi:GntR family transcriptional repressor for pyruvate dehydrogenase complex